MEQKSFKKSYYVGEKERKAHEDDSKWWLGMEHKKAVWGTGDSYEEYLNVDVNYLPNVDVYVMENLKNLTSEMYKTLYGVQIGGYYQINTHRGVKAEELLEKTTNNGGKKIIVCNPEDAEKISEMLEDKADVIYPVFKEQIHTDLIIPEYIRGEKKVPPFSFIGKPCYIRENTYEDVLNYVLNNDPNGQKIIDEVLKENPKYYCYESLNDWKEDVIDALYDAHKRDVIGGFECFEKCEIIRENPINTIDIVKLGAQIGMEAKEQKLPNGKTVNSLVWNQDNLLKAVGAVKHLSEEGKKVRITGAAPAWLVSAICHTVHPCPVSVYMPQIGKDVDIPQLVHGETNPEGEVAFKTTEKGDSILIEYNMDLPEGITTYDEENLPKVVVPEVPQGKAVYISGRGPNYLTVAIAEAYAHTNSSVSLFQPGVGYTCSITHSRSKRLGDLTKDPLGKEGLKEQLVAAKEEKFKEKTVEQK